MEPDLMFFRSTTQPPESPEIETVAQGAIFRQTNDHPLGEPGPIIDLSMSDSMAPRLGILEEASVILKTDEHEGTYSYQGHFTRIPKPGDPKRPGRVEVRPPRHQSLAESVRKHLS